MHRRVAAASAVLLTVAGGSLLAGPADGGEAGTTLPACPATSRTLTGSQSAGINAANDQGTWMLAGATWRENAPDPITYPIRSESWTKGCIVGGRVEGDVPKDWTRDQWYDGEDGGTRLGGEAFRQTLTDTADNFLRISDAYVEDYEDAYDPNGTRADHTVHLDHVEARYIRDDCIENEGSGSSQRPMTLVITDSLFDGCFTGIAERPSWAGGAQQNGSGPQSLTIEDSLMYVQPQPLGPNYCSASKVDRGRCVPTDRPDVWLGSYGIWKWSSAAASKVTVRNTVFRLDLPSYSSCAAQQWPDGTYENVTLVWTGDEPYASAGDCTNTLPPGVTLTTDVSVWDRAKQAWLDGGTAPSPSPSPTPSPSPSTSPSPSPSPTLTLQCPEVTDPYPGQEVVCTYR